MIRYLLRELCSAATRYLHATASVRELAATQTRRELLTRSEVETAGRNILANLDQFDRSIENRWGAPTCAEFRAVRAQVYETLNHLLAAPVSVAGARDADTESKGTRNDKK